MSEPSSNPESNKDIEAGKPDDPKASSANIVLYTPRPDTTGPARSTSGFSSGRARRRVSRMVATVAIAAAFGAISGAVTVGITQALQPHGTTQAADDIAAMRTAVARLDGELVTAKAGADRVSQANAGQLAKLAVRLDKIDRAQDETTARLAKIVDAQDRLQEKLRTASNPPAVAQQAAQDVTGSIPSQPVTAMPPKTEARVVAKPLVIEGWTLDRVSRGGAIVASRSGFYEVYPGDPLPGLGPVEAVRYQDGRWVVITPKGLIIKR